jgi:hypothetical protein
MQEHGTFAFAAKAANPREISAIFQDTASATKQ